MRNLLLSVSLSMLCVAATGCQYAVPRVGPKLAQAITRYCQEPQTVRYTLREQVNAQIAPHQVQVTCASDETR